MERTSPATVGAVVAYWGFIAEKEMEEVSCRLHWRQHRLPPSAHTLSTAPCLQPSPELVVGQFVANDAKKAVEVSRVLGTAQVAKAYCSRSSGIDYGEQGALITTPANTRVSCFCTV